MFSDPINNKKGGVAFPYGLLFSKPKYMEVITDTTLPQTLANKLVTVFLNVKI